MRTDVWQRLHHDLPPGVQPDQETYAAPFGGHTILLPIRQLADGQRGVASLIVNQASFAVLDALTDHLAKQIAPHRPDVVVAVPTLGLPLAEGVARRLGHDRMVPLSISRKFWYDDTLSVDMASITSPAPGKRLYLDPRMVPLLQGRVVVIDDVLSTGSSIAAVQRLMAKAGVRPVAIGAAMLQGEGWRKAVGETTVFGTMQTPILYRTENGWSVP